jgi:hypothetical protein
MADLSAYAVAFGQSTDVLLDKVVYAPTSRVRAPIPPSSSIHLVVGGA